jgi:hypothetical protein
VTTSAAVLGDCANAGAALAKTRTMRNAEVGRRINKP